MDYEFLHTVFVFLLKNVVHEDKHIPQRWLFYFFLKVAYIWCNLQKIRRLHKKNVFKPGGENKVWQIPPSGGSFIFFKSGLYLMQSSKNKMSLWWVCDVILTGLGPTLIDFPPIRRENANIGMTWLSAKLLVLLQSEARICNARQKKLVNHRSFNWVSFVKTQDISVAIDLRLGQFWP